MATYAAASSGGNGSIVGSKFGLESADASVVGTASNGGKSGVGEQGFEVCLGSHGEKAVVGAVE